MTTICKSVLVLFLLLFYDFIIDASLYTRISILGMLYHRMDCAHVVHFGFMPFIIILCTLESTLVSMAVDKVLLK